MGAKVYIPTPFRALTRNQATVEVEGKTIADLVEALDAEYPGISTLRTSGPALSPRSAT